MTVKLNNLNTIDEAKAAKYDGSQLTEQADKDVFDNSLIKNTDGTPKNVTDLRNTALLLEKLIKAKRQLDKSTTSDSLKTELESTKTKNGVDYQILSSRVDSEITRLGGLTTGGGDKKGGKTKKEWQTLLNESNSKIETYTKELEELSKQEEKQAEKTAEALHKLQNLQKKEKEIQILINGGKPEGSTLTNYSGLKNNTALKEILERMGRRSTASIRDGLKKEKTVPGTLFVTTNFSPSGRIYIGKQRLRNTIYQYADILRNINKTELFKSIDNNSSHFNLTTAERANIEAAWDRIMKAEWGWRIDPDEKSWPFYPFKTSKRGEFIKTSKEFNDSRKYYTDNLLWDKKDDNGNYLNYPHNLLNPVDFFLVMTKIFPESKLATNPLLDPSNSDCLKDATKKDNSVLDPNKFMIKWGGFSQKWKAANPSENKLEKVSFSLAHQNGGFGIFWNIWCNSNWYNVGAPRDDVPIYSSTDPDRSKTKIDFDWELNTYIAADENQQDKVKFVEAVKNEITNNFNARTDIDSPAEFDDEWKKTCFELAEVGAATFGNSTLDVLNKAIEDDKKKIPHLTTITLYSSLKFDVLDKFITQTTTKRLIAENDHKLELDRLGKIGDKRNAADANKQQAEDDKERATLNLEIFSGMDLESLKNKFNEYYKGGTNNGADNPKYHKKDLDTMGDLLFHIKEKSPNKTLDSTYSSYEKDLEDNVLNKIIAQQVLVEGWLILGDNFDDRINARYYPDEDDKRRQMNGLKDALDHIKIYRHWAPKEESEYQMIEKFLTGNYKPKEPKQKTDLTGADLNSLFHTSGLSDGDIKLTAWQGTNNFKTKEDVKRLIGDYYKGSGKTEEGLLKEHLNHQEWGAKWGGRKFSGDNYWIDLIKAGPEYVIGAIKHYEWENKKGEYNTDDKKNAVTTEMEEMNKKDETEDGDKKIKVKQKWDTSKAVHIAQFLYRKAIGKVGNDLIKEFEKVDKKGEDGKEHSWWKFSKDNIWRPALSYSLIFLAVVGVAAVIFWDTVSGWFGAGSTEEEGEKGEGEE